MQCRSYFHMRTRPKSGLSLQGENCRMISKNQFMIMSGNLEPASYFKFKTKMGIHQWEAVRDHTVKRQRRWMRLIFWFITAQPEAKSREDSLICVTAECGLPGVAMRKTKFVFSLQCFNDEKVRPLKQTIRLWVHDSKLDVHILINELMGFIGSHNSSQQRRNLLSFGEFIHWHLGWTAVSTNILSDCMISSNLITCSCSSVMLFWCWRIFCK